MGKKHLPSWLTLSQPSPGLNRLESPEHQPVTSLCTWACGTLVGTELEAAQESGLLLVEDGLTAVGLTVDEGMVLKEHAAFPEPVVKVGYRVPLLVLQPHQVAGSNIATPILEPAEQESVPDDDAAELPDGDDGELVMVEKLEGAFTVEVDFWVEGGTVEGTLELDGDTEPPIDGGREMPVTDTEVGWSGCIEAEESGGRVTSGGKAQLPDEDVDVVIVELDDDDDDGEEEELDGDRKLEDPDLDD